MSISPIIFSIKRGANSLNSSFLEREIKLLGFDREHDIKSIPQSYSGRGLVSITLSLFREESINDPLDLSRNETIDIALGETINDCQIFNLMPTSSESNFGPEVSGSELAKLRNNAFRNVAEAFFKISDSDIAYSSVNYDDRVFDVDQALEEVSHVSFALIKTGLVPGLESVIDEISSPFGKGYFHNDVISLIAGDFPFALDPYSDETLRGYGGNPLEDFHNAVDRVVSNLLAQVNDEKNLN